VPYASRIAASSKAMCATEVARTFDPGISVQTTGTLSRRGRAPGR
jgi:hypothetical protein